MAKRTSRKHHQIVVVGAGNAALTSAIEANDAGAEVVVLEKASEELRGGNTRFSGGIFRVPYEGVEELGTVIRQNDDASDVVADAYGREDYLRDMDRVTGGLYDETLVGQMVDRAFETVLWMSDIGVPWEFNRAVGAVKVPGSSRIKLQRGGGLRTRHEGVGLSESLFQIAADRGIPVRYETEAYEILQASDGSVEGVRVRDPGGIREIGAQAVVLASGGFQSSPQLRTAYLGPVWSLAKVRGTAMNSGHMMNAAFSVGAVPFGQMSGCHATPIDADAPTYGYLPLTDKTNRLSFPYSVMLNMNGSRFVDEGEDFNLYTYAKYGGEILKQPHGVAVQIFDATTVPLLEKRYGTGDPVVADTLEQLVEKLATRLSRRGFRATNALATLKQFNAAVQPGAFDPDSLDGKCTRGLDPEKSNWAVALETPPYTAYPVTGGITFTFGGIKINERAEVVNHLDRPILGLYATGEILGGFYYFNYPGGSGLTRGAVYGRIAGRNAASFVRAR